MDPWAAPAAAASLLLIATGVTKTVRPDASAVVLPVPPRTSRPLARALGVLEIAVGVGVLALGGRAALLTLAGLFTGFAVFAFVALRSGASSCGCTGTSGSPPTVAHVGMNLVFAVLAGLAAALSDAVPGGALARSVTDPIGAVVVLMTVLAAWLAWMVLGLGVLRSLASGWETTA
jgi:hypothetical protein